MGLIFRNAKTWKASVGRAKLGEANRYFAQQATEAKAGPNQLGAEPTTGAEILEATRRKQYAKAGQPSFQEARAPSAGVGDGTNGGAGGGPGGEGPGPEGSAGIAQPSGQRTFAPGEVEREPFGPGAPWTFFDFIRTHKNPNVPLADEAARCSF